MLILSIGSSILCQNAEAEKVLPLQSITILVEAYFFPSSLVSSPKKIIYSMSSDTAIHSGGCHCKRIRWQVEAPRHVVAWKCNCSDCFMRGNIHFIVPKSKFKLIGESCEQWLTTYTFGSHTAKHTFCKICGITSFYIPRSNPDGIAVTVNCVDPGSLTHIEIKHFDGRNWDASYEQTSISSFSKLK